MKIIEPKLSATALKIAQKRYLLTSMKGKVIETPGEMFWRVARHLAKAEVHWNGGNGNVTKMAEAFYQRMVKFKFVCAGRAMFEAGNPQGTGQLSSCFVLPIEDSIDSIFRSLGNAAVVHKNNGGTGFNFSKIRPQGDKVKNVPGAASGPVEFLSAYSAALARILQGSKRRGANIGILNVDHPDIEDFIKLKEQDGTIKNFNLSVGVTNEFMEAVKKNKTWKLVNPRTKEVVKRIKARRLFDQIVKQAYQTGDPGLLFLDRVNEDNPTPTLGKIDATNPCIAGDALVSTKHGLIKLDELYRRYHNPGRISLAIDHRTITGSGVHSHHSEAFYDQGEKEVWELVTKSGFKLRATPDHQVLTTNGWMELKNLDQDSQVLVQGGEGSFSQNRHLPFHWTNTIVGKNGKTYSWNLPATWSQELGQLLGWLIGDGFIRLKKTSGYVVLTFGRNSDSAVQHFHHLLSKWYGKVATYHPTPRTVQIKAKSKFLAKYFIRLGVLPVPSGQKQVPKSLFTAPRDAVIGFLQGLFSSDGTVNFIKGKSSYIRLTSKSKKLLEEVQLLLLNLGVRNKIYNRSRPPREKLFLQYTNSRGEEEQYRSDGVLWELEVSKDAVLKFLDEIGFLFGVHEQKIEMLRSKSYYRAKFYDPVVSVKHSGKARVYDLTEPITHSFIANGIVVSNCGEIPLLPYESCNLTSICLQNHSKKKKGKHSEFEIDWDDLEKSIRLGIRFLDNMIEVNTYPIPEIEMMVKNGNRRIGLGVMGWAHLLVKLRIPYNSNQAIKLADRLAGFIRSKAEDESRKMAQERGSFPNWDVSIYAGVMPMRNCATTMIAPTGTISLLADTTSGIEPMFSLVTKRRTFFEDDKKNQPTEEIYMVDRVFEEELKKLKAKSEERKTTAKSSKLDIKEILNQVSEGGLRSVKGLPKWMYKVFVTAHEIDWEWHVKTQAVWQKHFDNSIAKTINFPREATEKDVAEAYLQAWKLGCKGITIYRDGSKRDQVLNHLKTKSCPKCGAGVVFESGCSSCKQCGWSKCTI